MELDAPRRVAEPLDDAKEAQRKPGTTLFFLGRRIAVSAGRRATHEDLAAIEVLDEHANALRLAALRLIPEQLDLRADRQAGLRDAVSQQVGRRAAFDAPVRHVAVATLDVDPDPRMGIHELDLRDRPLEVDRVVLVKGRRK